MTKAFKSMCIYSALNKQQEWSTSIADDSPNHNAVTSNLPKDQFPSVNRSLTTVVNILLRNEGSTISSQRVV